MIIDVPRVTRKAFFVSRSDERDERKAEIDEHKNNEAENGESEKLID